MSAPIITTTTERLRADVRDDLFARLREAVITIVGGSLDGKKAITAEAFDDVWYGFWDEYEMPLPSEHAAEVLTPGRVVIGLVCPECGEAAPAAIRLDAVLTAEGTKRTLKVKGKSDPVDHVHGQQMLPVGDEVGTEPAFDMKDIVIEAEVDPEAAPHAFVPGSGDDGSLCQTCGWNLPDGAHFDPDEAE